MHHASRWDLQCDACRQPYTPARRGLVHTAAQRIVKQHKRLSFSSPCPPARIHVYNTPTYISHYIFICVHFPTSNGVAEDVSQTTIPAPSTAYHGTTHAVTLGSCRSDSLTPCSLLPTPSLWTPPTQRSPTSGCSTKPFPETFERLSETWATFTPTLHPPAWLHHPLPHSHWAPLARSPRHGVPGGTRHALPA